MHFKHCQDYIRLNLVFNRLFYQNILNGAEKSQDVDKEISIMTLLKHFSSKTSNKNQYKQ